MLQHISWNGPISRVCSDLRLLACKPGAVVNQQQTHKLDAPRHERVRHVPNRYPARDSPLPASAKSATQTWADPVGATPWHDASAPFSYLQADKPQTTRKPKGAREQHARGARGANHGAQSQKGLNHTPRHSRKRWLLPNPSGVDCPNARVFQS